jgi:hypothetical protein
MKFEFSFIFLGIATAPTQINNGKRKEIKLQLWFTNQTIHVTFHLKPINRIR